jgi:ligand-binding sensor domain-containing protein/DNA-binding CsgD family transcriptional regulator
MTHNPATAVVKRSPRLDEGEDIALAGMAAARGGIHAGPRLSKRRDCAILRDMTQARLDPAGQSGHRTAGWVRFTSILLLALLVPLEALAYSFSAVGVGSGLRARVVPALLVDQNGFLWVGSREGLFRYDGYEPIAYLPDPGDPDTISDGDIRSLHEDSSGTLWAGTYSGGLNRFQAATGTFIRYRHDSADPGSIKDDSILAIAEGPAGGLWVATGAGLSRLDHATDRFEHFSHGAAHPASLPGTQVRSLHRGPGGQLWVGTLGGGVSRWDPQSRSFTRFDLAALIAGPAEFNDVFSLHEDAHGRVWVGTRIGLVLLEPSKGTARELPLPDSTEFLPVIMAMAADRNDRLWLGTLVHGVLLLDMASLQWQMEPGDHRGLGVRLRDQPQISLALSQDMLLVGTWGTGVYRTTSHSTNFRLLDRLRSEALRDNNITAVLASPEPGQPWLGTQSSGPHRVRLDSGTVDPQAGLPANLANAMILDMTRTMDGQVWAATNTGLYSFTDAGLQTGHFAYGTGDPDNLSDDVVRALLPAGEGALWIGTDGSGLFRFEGTSGTLQHYLHDAQRPDSISDDHVSVLLEGQGGTLWVGTRSNGLNYCRVENWSCQRLEGGDEFAAGRGLSHFHVTSLFRDRDGQLWVGTGNGGLNQVLLDSGGAVTGFRYWTTEIGLLDDSIMSIEQDLDGSLWLATRRGLSRLLPETGQFINYVPESGLPAHLFNTGASAADSRFIYFGSVEGLLSFPKGSQFVERQASSVRIASMERAPPGQRSVSVHWAEGHVAIPHGEVLSIHLAVLDLSETPHEYSYRLSADDPWVSLDQQRQLILHGLAPGLYEVQARGRDVFGRWGESGALTLEIVPPFWMTTGFRAMVAALLLVLAIGAHLLRQAALERRSREIQRLGERREQALEERLGREAELAVLTPRQKEVLQLIAEGYSTREIAERLHVSVKTIEAHRANLMDRLGIHDVPGLVRLAIRARLVSQFD